MKTKTLLLLLILVGIIVVPGVLAQSSNISLTKTPSQSEVLSGTTVTYTYVVNNTGSTNLSTLGNVIITDDVLGTIGGPIDLGPGQSQTFTKSQVITSNTTNIATATGVLIFQNGTLIANTTAAVTVTVIVPPTIAGRMTGGGSISEDNTRIAYSFELNCDPGESPKNLRVNWLGNRFNLDSLTGATCSDDKTISPPEAPFDTYTGNGIGSYNRIPGATAQWIFTDAGEPGKSDTAKIQIRDVEGNLVLDIFGEINGNNQAHKN